MEVEPGAFTTSVGAPASRWAWRRGGWGPAPQHLLRPTGVSAPRPGPHVALRRALAGAGVASWGRVESACWVRRADAAWRVDGWQRVGSALGLGLHQALLSQGDQDDRSYKQCRTSSPSSTGSVSLGRYTPTSRSPQHYSRPGTWPPRLLLPPMKLVFLSVFLYESVSYTHCSNG